MFESEFNITFDDQTIICRRPDGAIETVAWEALGAVLIETNDEGPIASDVFWMLLARDMKSGCFFPSGASGENALLNAMQTRLPGFDNEAVISAMTSVENQRFLIWRRPE